MSKCPSFITPHVQSSKEEIRDVLKEILTLPPLSLTKEEVKSLSIQGHSCHGSPSDWARVIGPNPQPCFPTAHGEVFPGFDEADARALGHWLRDANAPDAEAEDRARKKPRGQRTTGGQGRAASDPTIAPGGPARIGEMSLRYTQGSSREGERATQLRLRARLAEWTSRALANWCHVHSTTWLSLPKGRADIQILILPPSGVMPVHRSDGI